MIEKTGVATSEMVKEVFPLIDRINEGPVAVIECFKRIPCNPCETACKFNAISIGQDINNRPILDTKKCTGCGSCISKCPGLSIMVVDGSKSENKLHFKIPYEFIPLPEEGKVIEGLNRKGEFICDVKVVKVQNPKSFDRTPIITLEVDRKFMYDFRNIKVVE